MTIVSLAVPGRRLNDDGLSCVPHPAARVAPALPRPAANETDAADALMREEARQRADAQRERVRAPLVSLLRPVSPLAWLPIGLMVFKAANPAAIWVIFISSIWPMIINTAVGVQRIPQDYLNVARVLNLSEWKVLTRILFPATLPYMLTGVRLAIGIAWLVIVAAEMLTGGVGIGFWVWDEWNNLKVDHIIIAIFVVGIVGLLLEHGLLLVARRFN